MKTNQIGITIIADIVCDDGIDPVSMITVAQERVAELLDGKSLAKGKARFRNALVSIGKEL